ncbi:hypothetical protein [Herbidospora cretacea]|uniref:hypothetical protein n=1 Tax=Herbidospora cretacea TaxID=28444 RepID=UPI0012F765B3|nr:hypothetical protein [Herbidospora cretacea]
MTKLPSRPMKTAAPVTKGSSKMPEAPLAGSADLKETTTAPPEKAIMLAVAVRRRREARHLVVELVVEIEPRRPAGVNSTSA